MCGIVGQVGGFETPERVEAVLQRQLASLRHRGPDDIGYVVEPGFALGHARLSIIDPALGHQPLAASDESAVITFNGEIYNYVELRDELIQAGYAFRTTSDTEVLVAGYQHWGTEVLDRLEGMFAFALWDRRRRTLFCARDPYGQKPFFYHLAAGRFAFSSECRTFRELPGFDGRVDPASIADFLAFESFPFDRSIYRDVRKLPAGHYLTFADGELRIVPYFESVPEGTRPVGSVEEVDAEVHALLERSVMRTFRADVPVGLLLSGGLDSSMILAILRDVHPAVPLTTFTVRNIDRSFDESEAAALLADRFATEHRVVTAEPATLARIAAELPARLDEPQADPGVLPKSLVCAEIAKTTKVALTGDGGDEFFYGYAIFRAVRFARYARLLPDALHRRVIRPLTQLVPSRNRYMGIDLKLKAFAKGFPAPDHLRNFYWTCAFSDHALSTLIAENRRDLGDVRRELGRIEAHWNRAQGSLGRLAYLYQRHYLPDYVLTNSDRASMLHSVELRTPFLAPELVRMLNALPDSVKMRGGETKSILRRIAHKVLPGEIARGRKVGFTAPVASLIRNELREEIREYLGAPHLRAQGLFRDDYVARLLDDHFTGRHNHYKQIWVLYMLQKWLHVHRAALA
ncbi:MAG TPA: asparagine synthase (glutamine-hydrolyzing) [Casimicrobiaceae bacterium]|nr:asparagine synthase (glutamine-hydrolyzing) [Casimicrobiaceae bacterium]